MRIPVYERQQGISPLSFPSAPVTPPISDNGQYTGNVLQGVFSRLQKISDDMEDARTLELFDKFKMDSQEYHENPDKGIYHTKLGYLSRGIYKEADQWLREKGESYVEQLPSVRAKDNFRKMAREHIEQRGLQNSRFEADQMKKYTQEQAQASINNALVFAEQNWNKPEAIEQARRDIQQALELKLRGSGQDVFNHELAELEDKLGVARIRQAFTQHPLLALEMLRNPDVKLKPETAAKLRESLTKSTEVYEIQGIVQAYSQYYTPSQAVEAQKTLVNRFGADKGQKAFQALIHFWQVGNYQINARDKAKRDAQIRAEGNYLAMLDNAESYDPSLAQQIKQDRDNQTIGAQFAHSALGLLDAQRQQEERLRAKAQTDFQNAAKAQVRIDVWKNIQDGKYPTNEELEQYVQLGIYTPGEANTLLTQVEQQENKRKQANKSAMLRDFRNGTLTDEKITQAMNSDDIKPDDAYTLAEHVRARNERIKRGEKEDEIQAREDFQRGLRIIINNGGIVPRKQVNELLTSGKIDDAFAKELWEHERKYNAEQERLQKAEQAEQARLSQAQAKEQAKTDEARHKEELDKRAQDLATMYYQKKGEGLEFINSLNIPLEDREFLRSKFSAYIGDKEQRAKDTEAWRKQLEEKHVNDMWFGFMTAVNSQQEIDDARSMILDLKSQGPNTLSEHNYNLLAGVLDKKEKAIKTAQEALRKDRLYDEAKNLAARFQQGSEQDGYSFITESYSREDAEDVRKYYDRFIQEQKTATSNEAKALAETQEKNYSQLIDDYWKKGLTVPTEELNRLERSQGLSAIQLEHAYDMNLALSRKKGMEDDFRKYNINGFNDKSPTEQEAIIMMAMGTDQDQRAANVAYLFEKVVNDTATNAEIEHYRAFGGITDADAEMLKEYGPRFEKRQKGILEQRAKDLQRSIQELYKGEKGKSHIWNNAVVDFYNGVSGVNLKASNFTEVVDGIFNDIFSEVVKEFDSKKSLTKWRFGTVITPAGERSRAAHDILENSTTPQVNHSIPFMDAQGNMQSISPAGQLQPFDNSAPLPVRNEQPQEIPAPLTAPVSIKPEPSDIDNTPPAPRNIGLNMVKGGVVTGRFSDPRAYSNGTHHGVDIAGEEGSPITLSEDVSSIPLTVSRVNIANPSKGGGNSVTLSGTDGNGDKWDFIISHMQNGSIPLRVGDVVTPGTLIGRIGNTGMTSDRKKGGITAWYEGKSSGYHMDLKIKKNGKYIDPEKFVPPARSSYVGPTREGITNFQPPQPIIPPAVSSDEDMYRMALGILGLDSNPLWEEISGDIASSQLFGGY